MSRSFLGAAALLAFAFAPTSWGCAAVPPSPDAAQSPEPVAAAAEPPVSNGGPMYKPSSSSPAAIDISTNAYGAFSGAPEAPEIGDVAADFELPLADGGRFSLADARKAGPVLVMFYRGFW